jgi:transketolase N-terminal domain/subunit
MSLPSTRWTNQPKASNFGASGSKFRTPRDGPSACMPLTSSHGLGIAVGMALGLKRKASAAFVYNLFSDGELDEGSTWEAAMSAASFGLISMPGV